MRTPWFFVILVGCGFPGLQGSGSDAGPDPDAAMSDGPTPDAVWPSGVDFLPTAAETFVDVDWTIDADTLIDTTFLTSSIAPPLGVTLLIGVQDGGAEIVILRVGSLKVNAGRTLSVQGTRPFAILANKDITLDGALDVGAHGAIAGPGGSSGGNGMGAGGIAKRDDGTGSTYDDSGAGGGGFGTPGAAGGKAGPFTGGVGGAMIAIGNQLLGGGSGGLAANCTNRPGSGGGALLVYSKTKIKVNASINAGGGGGEGGITACIGGAGPGAGGGAGGVIWLQAKDLDGNGILAANGGGGGGASFFGLPNGGPGGDGQPSVSAVAMGGTKANSVEATAGGNGAIQGTEPSMVPDLAKGNGGGGGGGLGRIVVRTQKLSPMLKSSPTAVPAP